MKDTNHVSYTQHFTTRSDLIIGNLWDDLPDNICAVEPYYGSGDLIKKQPENKIKQWEYYDIDITNCKPEEKHLVIEQDTLLNPPDYNGKYVITNPPYLAKNKTINKTVFNKYQVDDLYKASIKTIMDSEGGILVIPLNFLTDKRTQKLRTEFLEKYTIKTINIFNDPVFDNTNYQICSFSYLKKDNSLTRMYLWENNNMIFSDTIRIGKGISALYADTYNQLFNNKLHYKYSRIIKDKEYDNIIPITFNLVDSNKKGYSLSLQDDYSYSIHADYDTVYYGKNTDRTKASFSIDKQLNIDWEKLACDWNKEIKEYRKKTHNICLTSFRDASRKKLTFTETIHIIDSLIRKQLC